MTEDRPDRRQPDARRHDLDTEGKLFLGWFGPRGLASIVFAVIVLDANLPHGETITAVVASTVVLSIVLHGVTATPWATAFGARVDAGKRPG